MTQKPKLETKCIGTEAELVSISCQSWMFVPYCYRVSQKTEISRKSHREIRHYAISLHLLCPDLSDPSSLTECTSDNQHLGSSNDTNVAKHLTLKSQLTWGTDYLMPSFLGGWTSVSKNAGKKLHDVNSVQAAITPSDTTALAKKFSQWARIKLSIFIAVLFSMQMLQFDIWHTVGHHFLPQLFSQNQSRFFSPHCIYNVNHKKAAVYMWS